MTDEPLREGLFRSLAEIAQFQPPSPTIKTGLAQVDEALGGGLRPGLLNMVVGFAANGKTSLMLAMICAQPKKHHVFISQDEPAWLILRRLHGFYSQFGPVHYDRMKPEGRIKEVEEWFPKITIVGADDPAELSRAGVIDIMQRSELIHDCPVDALFFDYCNLLQTGIEGAEYEGAAIDSVTSKADWFKDLAHHMTGLTTVIGHQANRGSIGSCKQLDFSHVQLGGEQQVDGVMLGCRIRLRAESAILKEEEVDKLRDDPTCHVSIMKNKITAGSTHPAGVMCSIDKKSGRIQNYKDQARRR